MSGAIAGYLSECALHVVVGVEAAHEAGTRLPELIEDLGADPEAVHEAVQTAREDAFNQARAALEVCYNW